MPNSLESNPAYVSYWRIASLTLPSARCASMRRRWADSRSGSAAIAASAASIAVTVPVPHSQAPAELFQSVYSNLAKTLPLDDHPVVVPTREQIGGKTGGRQVVERLSALEQLAGARTTSSTTSQETSARDTSPLCKQTDDRTGSGSRQITERKFPPPR